MECSGNVGAATWSLPDTFVTREANSFNGNVGEELENPFPDSYYGGAVIDLPFAFKWFGGDIHTGHDIRRWRTLLR